jgi:hypothetical protein
MIRQTEWHHIPESIGQDTAMITRNINKTKVLISA